MSKNGRVIAIATTKGGEGKTTLTINLAACLAVKGHSVMVIDTDPQQSMTNAFNTSEGDRPFEVMHTCDPEQIQLIGQLRDSYDFVLVDGAAILTAGTAAMCLCADLVLIPVKASPLSFAATSAVLECVKARGGELPYRYVRAMHQQKARFTQMLLSALVDGGHPYIKTPFTARPMYVMSTIYGAGVYASELKAVKSCRAEIDNIAREVLEVFNDK